MFGYAQGQALYISVAQVFHFHYPFILEVTYLSRQLRHNDANTDLPSDSQFSIVISLRYVFHNHETILSQCLCISVSNVCVSKHGKPAFHKLCYDADINLASVSLCCNIGCHRLVFKYMNIKPLRVIRHTYIAEFAYPCLKWQQQFMSDDLNVDAREYLFPTAKQPSATYLAKQPPFIGSCLTSVDQETAATGTGVS